MTKKDISINILWEFTDKPWGGGNQFLKALRNQLRNMGKYAETPEEADVILFNSHQLQKQILKLKLRYPYKLFIHRVDGPLFYTRGKNGIATDQQIFFCNDLIADGTIYQSQWSRQASYKQGMNKNAYETCIINAPDPTIFYQVPKAHYLGKIRLIATTWSANERKGFDIFHFLDNHLDFEKYSMTFVGNTETPFNNIITIAPQPSQELATLLRNHDIFIAASKGEPCSNSFLEALHSGLPCIARNDASYPELLNGNGLLFEGTHDVINKIEALACNLEQYCRHLTVRNINQVANDYLDFCRNIKDDIARNAYLPKKISIIKYYLSRSRLKTM